MSRNPLRRVAKELDIEIIKFQKSMSDTHGLDLKYTQASKSLARIVNQINLDEVDVEKKKKKGKYVFKI